MSPTRRTGPRHERLTIELEIAALARARAEYASLNDTLFGARLRRCRLEIVDPGSRLGRWISEYRVI